MINTIDARYLEAVQKFDWSEQVDNSTLSISNVDLDAVVNEIAQKIIAASQLRPIISQIFQDPLSLSQTWAYIVQDLDNKFGQQTIQKILNASAKEVKILNQTVKKLSDLFKQVTNEDLKAATLLFGIQRIHELAAANLTVIPTQLTKTQQMELALSKLILERNQISNEAMTKGGPSILAKINEIDQAIEKYSELLKTLKQPQ